MGFFYLLLLSLSLYLRSVSLNRSLEGWFFFKMIWATRDKPWRNSELDLKRANMTTRYSNHVILFLRNMSLSECWRQLFLFLHSNDAASCQQHLQFWSRSQRKKVLDRKCQIFFLLNTGSRRTIQTRVKITLHRKSWLLIRMSCRKFFAAYKFFSRLVWWKKLFLLKIKSWRLRISWQSDSFLYQRSEVQNPSEAKSFHESVNCNLDKLKINKKRPGFYSQQD